MAAKAMCPGMEKTEYYQNKQICKEKKAERPYDQRQRGKEGQTYPLTLTSGTWLHSLQSACLFHCDHSYQLCY